MSSGVPRGSGKNQVSEHVIMAANEGKMQNLPRGGGKNHNDPGNLPSNDTMSSKAPRGAGNSQYGYNEYSNIPPSDGIMPTYPRGVTKSQYPEHPNMLSHEMHGGPPIQPQFTPNANVHGHVAPGSNPMIFAAPGARLSQTSNNFYTIQMGQQSIPQQQPYYMQPAPLPFAPYYNPTQQFTHPNYAQQFQQIPQAPQEQVQQTSVPASTVPSKREKKPLLIVDPNTKCPVNIEKPTSNNVTPNTTVDEKEEVQKAAFRKDFSKQVESMIHKPDASVVPPPVAQSEHKGAEPDVEIKDTADDAVEETDGAPIETQDDLCETDDSEALPQELAMQKEKSSFPSVTLAPVAEVTDALEKANLEGAMDKVPIDVEEQSATLDTEKVSLQMAQDDAEAASPSVSVEVQDDDEEESASPSPDPEEEKRIREEEEAESLRQKQVEMDQLRAELEQNPEECNVESCSYGRNFMYCIRDIEKLFKRTEPPVSLDALKNTFYIDIHSMPKAGDGKKQQRHTDFNPPWATKSGSIQGNRGKYTGRTSRDHGAPGRGGGAGGGKKPYNSRQSIGERAPKVQLTNRAENAWKAEKIRNEDLDKDENKIKLLLKAVRSLLNKITPTTKDDLINEFLALHVSGGPPDFSAPEGQLEQVIEIIFDKAVEEPRFCSLYSEICKKQVQSELKYNKTTSPFRNAILTRAQNTFVNKAMDDNKATIDNETDETKKKEMLLKYEEENSKFRRRKFGNINFIGQLYDQQLLSSKIIQWCLFDLLRHSHPDADGRIPDPPFDEESIQCAAQLMEAVGKTMEKANDFNGVDVYSDQVFNHMMRIAPLCSSKIKFKIYGVNDLRANKWKQRKVVDQGPKKITEIHQEIQQEHAQLMQDREAYDRKQGQGVRQSSNSLRRNAPPPSRSSLDSRFNNPQNKRAAAGTASKLVPSSAAQPRQTMSMSMQGNQSQRKSWQKGATGGGNNDGPGSRTIIQRNSGSREGSESRKNSTIGERESSLQAAREIAGNPPRSASQLSIASQEEQEKLDEEKEEKQSKLSGSIVSRFLELKTGDLTEDEFLDDLFDYTTKNKERFGNPEVPDVFHRFVQAYVEKLYRDPTDKANAVKILSRCFAQQPEKKGDILKGIENFCIWAIKRELWDDLPNFSDSLAELLVTLLPMHPTGEHVVSLKELSPVFLAASEDYRQGRTYSLLVMTIKLLAEALASNHVEDGLQGLAMDFEELVNDFRRVDRTKLDAALRSCNPDVPGHSDLYALLHVQQ